LVRRYPIRTKSSVLTFIGALYSTRTQPSSKRVTFTLVGRGNAVAFLYSLYEQLDRDR